MKKKVMLLLSVLLLGGLAQAEIPIEDIIKAGIKVASKKVNCDAYYTVTQRGAFGKQTTTQVVQIRANSSREACHKAKAGNRRGKDAFGKYSKTLSSLLCTNALGQSEYVQCR